MTLWDTRLADETSTRCVLSADSILRITYPLETGACARPRRPSGTSRNAGETRVSYPQTDDDSPGHACLHLLLLDRASL